MSTGFPGQLLSLKIDTSSNITNNPADTGPPSGQDSLSLGQLKKLVNEGVKQKPPEYLFTYKDTDVLQNELNDFFPYDPLEENLLLAAKSEFEEKWAAFLSMGKRVKPGRTGKARSKRAEQRWRVTVPDKRKRFVVRWIDSLEDTDQLARVKALEVLSYLVQGVFGEAESEEDQLYWVVENGKLLRSCGAVESVYQVLRGIMSKTWDNLHLVVPPMPEDILLDKKELRHSLAILYFIFSIYIPSAFEAQPSEDLATASKISACNAHIVPKSIIPTAAECDSIRDELADLDPPLPTYLIRTVSQTRWEEDEKQKQYQIPIQQLLLLTWKSLILTIGSITNPTHLAKTKSWGRQKEGLSKEVDKKTITASPLDYHLFRQDLIAKYPAYNPPPVVVEFEIEGLKRSSSVVANGGPGGGMLGGPVSSILNQPVHIATPAPSPPPSPVGGKGGKKQNYQTNQNFPFLYPPPSSSSLATWTKEEIGNAGDCSNVPESIVEAAEIFLTRIRTTLAMRQLWKEREEFLRHERGWSGGYDDNEENPEVDREVRVNRNVCMEGRRLQSVEQLYRTSLAQLQSFIIMCLKILLQTLCIPPVAPLGQPASAYQTFDDRNMPTVEESNNANGMRSVRGSLYGKSEKELNMMRENEIMSKAVSAIFLHLLKWFRMSHVLKFEYLTQLLLDTNFIPLQLRIFAHLDVPQHVVMKTDRQHLSYMYFCKLHSAAPQTERNNEQSPIDIHGPESFRSRRADYDVDDAVPPPIKLRRDSTIPIPPPQAPPPSKPPPPPPTVSDENPQDDGNSSSTDPIKRENSPEIVTDITWRNFFTVVNSLRVLQKIVKGKAHRNLLMVQYKSSGSLRKALRCSQNEMRLYTLKLFKGQVPYCGRKWRHGNMKVITGIYLHCRPELRDDWLTGTDVDAEVEDAMPQEQAIRALTNFYNIRRYPEALGANNELLEEERDFFARELEKMQILGVINDLSGEGVGNTGDIGDSGGNFNGQGEEENGGVGAWENQPLMEEWLQEENR